MPRTKKFEEAYTAEGTKPQKPPNTRGMPPLTKCNENKEKKQQRRPSNKSFGKSYTDRSEGAQASAAIVQSIGKDKEEQY